MDTVEEVKSRLNIEDVVGQYVELKRSGSSLKGLCPFHTEKTPSFYVFPARSSFHCFGCGQGGDILSFIQSYEKVDFREALQRLAAQAGVEMGDSRAQKQQAEANARLYAANEVAADFFRAQLKTGVGERAVRYLASRHIAAGVQHAFELGYAPDSRQALEEVLIQRGYSEDEAVEAGLLIRGEDGRTRDRFHGRLMFPIRDRRGRITGFGGRIIGSGEPKYLNSPQTEIFDKSRSLFGIQLAQEPIRKAGRAVVVEGYFDAIRAHQAGFSDVVASLGTAITVQQLQACSRLAPTVILALDPDAAGQAAAARTAMSALAALPRRQQQLPDSMGRRMVDVGLTVDLRIARIPAGLGDPDELIEREPAAWTQILESSVPAFEYYFDSVLASVDRDTEGWRQEIIDRILPVIEEFPFAVGVQAAWIERLGEATGVQPRLLQNRLPSASGSTGSRRPGGKSKLTAQPPSPGSSSTDPQEDAENSLLQILLTKPCPPELVAALKEIQPRRTAAQELLSKSIAAAETGRRPRLDGLSSDATELASKLTAGSPEELRETRVAPAVRLHIASIRLNSNRRRLRDVQDSLGEIGPEDTETVLKSMRLLMEERADLEKQVDELQKTVIAAG